VPRNASERKCERTMAVRLTTDNEHVFARPHQVGLLATAERNCGRRRRNAAEDVSVRCRNPRGCALLRESACADRRCDRRTDGQFLKHVVAPSAYRKWEALVPRVQRSLTRSCSGALFLTIPQSGGAEERHADSSFVSERGEATAASRSSPARAHAAFLSPMLIWELYEALAVFSSALPFNRRKAEIL
jgi:hypothetical protein